MKQSQALKILKSGKNVFLNGEPGAGKTYTINQFTKWLKENGIRFAVTASTGIAATHINGMTIHSWSGIGIKEKLTDGDIMRITEKPWNREKFESTKVLIIDEISMLNAQTLDNVDRVLRIARNTHLSGIPFGGIQVVFVGDFFQLPPVTKGFDPKFAWESQAWKDANPTVCYLTEQHRQDDKEFLEILTAMRNGKVLDSHKKRLETCKKTEKSATRLFTHNVDVEKLNEQELAKIDGEEKVFYMEATGNPVLVEMLKKACLSPEKLTLRVGAVVMFTRNNFEEGYVNGTLGVVKEYEEDGLPVVETKDGRTITVGIAEWRIEDTNTTITQIPLRLAWAITVHKSQGMSLDEACVDLRSAFEFGQGYVALSRVRSLKGLHLEGINVRALEMHPKVVAQDKIFRELSVNEEK